MENIIPVIRKTTILFLLCCSISLCIGCSEGEQAASTGAEPRAQWSAAAEETPSADDPVKTGNRRNVEHGLSADWRIGSWTVNGQKGYHLTGEYRFADCS